MTDWRRLVPALAAIGVIGLTFSLGQWQIRRAHEKQALGALREQAALAAPLPLQAALPDPPPGRRVEISGRFLPDRTILIDNRTHQGVAGFHVLTPLRSEDGRSTVLVLRGWQRSDPANRFAWPTIETPDAVVTVVGEPQATLPQAMQLGKDATPGPGDRIWQYFSLPKYQQWSGLTVEPFIIRQTSSLDDRLARDWPQPANDVDRHYGYAFQWFGMALATAVLWIWYGWRRRSPTATRR